MDIFRVGTVSSVNAAAGSVSVTYPDRGDGATSELPCLNFGGEYKMPNKGDTVIVLHAQNGSSEGVVLGTVWNEANKPPVSSGYQKDMGGGAKLTQSGGNVEISASGITLNGGGSITVAEIIAKLNDHEARITALGG
jgi:phage baseplate assembly protein gpV